MQPLLRVAVVQLCAQLDKGRNVATAERLIRAAAAGGAELVVLPELFNAYGRLADVVAQAEPIPGPTSKLLARLAQELGIMLCGGSLCEQSTQAAHGYNTSLLLGRDGVELARYRKQHLFDIDLPGQVSVRESDAMLPGSDVCVTTTELGNIAQAICYDVRFPELFRALSQRAAEIVCIPAAFTANTGRDHWEVLLRARAIENQCFILAANQYGSHHEKLASYGGSLIIDPWGDVLARGTLDSEEVLFAELTNERLQQVRTHLPALQHRRL
jgi:predicted amidohydrolase